MSDRWRSPIALAALAALATLSGLVLIAAVQRRSLTWWDLLIIGVVGAVVYTLAQQLGKGLGRDRFTPDARETLVRAQADAISLGNNYIGTEHLLLGLLGGEGPTSQALVSRGVSRSGVRAAIEETAGRQTSEVGPQVGLTPRAKRIIERSVDAAVRGGNRRIDDRHILIGLVEEWDGLAALVMRRAGVDRAELVAALRAMPTEDGDL